MESERNKFLSIYWHVFLKRLMVGSYQYFSGIKNTGLVNEQCKQAAMLIRF